MDISKQLESVSAKDLDAYARKRMKSADVGAVENFRQPGQCKILVVSGEGVLGGYIGSLVDFNKAQPLDAHRFKMDVVGGLDDAVLQLSESVIEAYDAVIIPPEAHLTDGVKSETIVPAYEFVLSIKKYNVTGQDFARKKEIMRAHLSGETEVDRGIMFDFLRKQYSEVPFVFPYLIKTDTGIKEIIALRNRYEGEDRLRTIHIFEAKPGNHPQLWRRLISVIKKEE